jgi:hypothetical protein
MVPWPIALLTLFYGVLATISAAALWKSIAGQSVQHWIVPLFWLLMSGAAMCGLPLLKPWARRVAVFVSVLLVIVCISLASLFIVGRQPVVALAATLGAGVHLVVIRYLRRPLVKSAFETDNTQRA